MIDPRLVLTARRLAFEVPPVAGTPAGVCLDNLVVPGSAVELVGPADRPDLLLRATADGLVLLPGHATDEPIGRIDPEHGGLCWLTDAGWLHLLPWPWRPVSGPLVVLADSGPLLQAALQQADDLALGIAAAATWQAGDSEGLLRLVEHAGRHPRAAAIVIVAHDRTVGEDLGRLLRDASAHVPIVALDLPAQTDPERAAWLAACGVLPASSVRDALAAASLLVELDPPGTPSVRVDAASPSLARLIATVLANAVDTDVELSGTSRRPPRPVGVVIRALDTDAAALAERLHEIVEAAPSGDAPTVWYLTGERRRAARTRLREHAVPAVTDLDELVSGLRAVQRWARRRAIDREQVAWRCADPQRLRRTLAGIRTDPASLGAPDTHANLLAAIGIPLAPSERVPYVEDALIAAARIGYPVWVATDEREGSQRLRARNADELGEAAGHLQAEAQRRSGRRCALLVGSDALDGLHVTLAAAIHPDYGPRLVLRAGNVTRWAFGQLHADDVAAFLDTASPGLAAEPLVVASIVAAGEGLLFVIRSADMLQEVRISPLIVSRAGCAASRLVPTPRTDA